MLNDVNFKPSPSVYSCKSFITDGNGHKFKDKSFFVVKHIDQYFVRRFFSLCPSLICKTKFEYRNQIQHRAPALNTQDAGDEEYWMGDPDNTDNTDLGCMCCWW